MVTAKTASVSQVLSELSSKFIRLLRFLRSPLVAHCPWRLRGLLFFLSFTSLATSNKKIEKVVQNIRDFPFPEEAQRALWDRGCEQWPLNLESPQLKFKKNPSLKISKREGLIEMLAVVTFYADKGERPLDVLASLEKNMLSGSTYPEWVLPGVNDKPGGGKYFVELSGLKTIHKPYEKHWHLIGPYSFNLLWVNLQGTTTLSFRHMRTQVPFCPPFKGLGEALKVIYRMTPREGLLDFLIAEVWALPHPLGAEMRARMIIKTPNLIYQILPEQLLRFELESRADRMFQNFIDFRRRVDVLRNDLNTDATKKSSPKGKDR